MTAGERALLALGLFLGWQGVAWAVEPVFGIWLFITIGLAIPLMMSLMMWVEEGR